MMDLTPMNKVHNIRVYEEDEDSVLSLDEIHEGQEEGEDRRETRQEGQRNRDTQGEAAYVHTLTARL